MENERFTCLPSLEEVKDIVMKMNPFKSPDPDGFSAGFFQKSWHIIYKDLYSAIKNFFQNAYLPPEISQTNIILIPNINNPTSPADFRPISLTNVTYKIIAKIITKRITPSLDKCVDRAQHAFMPGRLIFDAIGAVHEAQNKLKNMTGKAYGMGIKIDLSKAYDTIDHNFILNILKARGFNSKFINIIKACITNVNFNVIINGTKTEGFMGERGLRQGCPLSPYLFVLSLDVLSSMIAKPIHTKVYSPIRFRGNKSYLSHVLYADDYFLFGEASLNQWIICNVILKNIYDWTGLKMNPNKSAILFSNDVPIRIRDNILEISHMNQIESNSLYLGVPLVKGKGKASDFQFIIDKIQIG